MTKKIINFEIKQKLIALSWACFRYRKSFYDFLKTYGVSWEIISQLPREGIKKYDAMRNILTHLEDKWDVDTINNIISWFYNLTWPIDRDPLDIKKAKELLDEFKKAVGNDPIENEIKKQRIKEVREKNIEEMEKKKNKDSAIYELNNIFKAMLSSTLTPQKKGYELEKIFIELLRINELTYTWPYKIEWEQIDGYVSLNKFDYLIECKFESSPIDKNSVAEFDNKLKSKAQSTRGIILSYTGFDPYVIKNFSWNSPRIILMDWQELFIILEGYFDLIDALNKKIDALVRKWNIYCRIY
jgi:hypothetical protein